MYRDEDLVLTLDAVREEKRAREAAALKASLMRFVRRFWPVIEGGAVYKENWHHRVMAEHLEALTRGDIINLLMNVPPGTSKSTFTSVFWPAWEWASDPGLRFFSASYSEPLALRDALLMRKIVESEDYRYLFPHVALAKGQAEKRKYESTKGGWRLTTTVKGRGTGEHPHRKIIDDPHNVKQSESDVERQEALDWMDGTMSSRGLMLNARTAVIMQRLHERDFTGHIMSGPTYDQWCHIVMPMRYEPARKYFLPDKKSKLAPLNPLKFKDPRTVGGELLWPEVFTRAKVETLELNLGKYRTAGQLQQRPAPDGGGIFEVGRVQLWPKGKPLPIFSYILQSYDTAFTENVEDNDPTACSVWGVFGYNDKFNYPKTGVMLLDCWEEWLSYPALRPRLIADWKQKYGGNPKDPANNPRRPDAIMVEEKGSGINLIQDMRVAGVPLIAYNPGHASKIARGHIAAPVLEAGLVWVLESSKRGMEGHAVAWAQPFLDHLEAFPNGEHNDWADTFSQAMIRLKNTGHLELESVIEEVDDTKDYSKKRANPYG